MNKEFRGLELSEIIFIGRTYDEYIRMFDLSDVDIRNQEILDAPAGACSFAAISNSRGGNVTAADIAYFYSKEELFNKGLEDIHQAVSGLSKVTKQYVWDYFKDLESLERSRLQALQDCVNHMKLNPDVYVPCVLPELPFEDKRFDITLSAHFLFMYADRLNLEFHREVIEELLRVSKKEVRLFPLVDLKSNKYSEFEPLLEFIHSLGWKTEERVVDYEFQRNANLMLRIYKDL